MIPKDIRISKVKRKNILSSAGAYDSDGPTLRPEQRKNIEDGEWEYKMQSRDVRLKNMGYLLGYVGFFFTGFMFLYFR